MPRSNFYYLDYKNDRDRRYRLTITPADSAVLTPTDVPAWGADPSGSSNYVKIPASAISVLGADPTSGGDVPIGSAVAFTEGLPWGMSETETFKITVNLGGLQSTVPLQELSTYIIEPTSAAAGTINPGESYARTFATSTLFTITHDGDNAALAVTSFPARYQGVIRKQSGRTGKITPGRTVTMDIELYHAAVAALENVTMADVSSRVLATTYTTTSPATTSPLGGLTGMGAGIDLDYTDSVSGRQYRTTYAPTNQRAKFFSLGHLFAAMQRNAEQAYCAFTRQTPSYSGAGWHFRLRSHAEDATDYFGTPFDAWSLKQQGTTETCAAGAALTIDEVFFIGTIYVYFGLGGLPDPSAGLLIAGEHSFHNWATAWDFLVDATNSAGPKAVVTQTTATQCDLWFRRQRATSIAATTTLTADDIEVEYDPEGDPQAIEFEQDADVVLAADSALRYGMGDDVTEYSVTTATNADSPITIKCIFDTSPMLGPGDIDSGWRVSADSGGYTYSAFVRDWGYWKLFYLRSDGQMQRCHHFMGIDVSAADNTTTTLTYGTTIPSLPTPASGGDAWDDFIHPLREQVVELQQTTGLMVNLVEHALDLYGTRSVRWTMMLGDDIANANRLGDSFSFSANDVLGTGESYLATVSGFTYLVSVEVNDTTNLATCELLAIS